MWCASLFPPLPPRACARNPPLPTTPLTHSLSLCQTYMSGWTFRNLFWVTTLLQVVRDSQFTHSHMHTFCQVQSDNQIHTFTNTFTHSQTHSHIHKHIQTFTNAFQHSQTHSNVHKYIHPLTNAFKRSQTHSNIHKHIQTFTNTFTHTHIHTHIQTFTPSLVLAQKQYTHTWPLVQPGGGWVGGCGCETCVYVCGWVRVWCL